MVSNLDESEIFLPPEELSVSRTKGRSEVISVHEDMHEAVEHGAEERRAAGHVLDPDPPEAEHGGVVVDVEKGQLAFSLPDNEEHGVEHLKQFAEVVPPKKGMDSMLMLFRRPLDSHLYHKARINQTQLSL